MHNYWLIEILLALAAALVASQYWYIARDRCRSPALLVVAAMLSLALAAIAGAYRYGIDPATTGLHRALTQLSGYLTFLLSGLALLWVRLAPQLGRHRRWPAYAVLALVLAAAVGAVSSPQFSAAGVSRFCSTLGIALWLLVALWRLFSARFMPRYQALLLAAGAVLVVFAGLVIGTGATTVLGLARTNWFHLLLAAGALSLLCARPLFTDTDHSQQAPAPVCKKGETPRE
ncbi:hypothetical protein [Microbulbifer litoralis]|uniref:hypothetical protein n=1 Tax=Microbulbifer litoralis TaxID=2933965 RepID=UPI00202900F2|nr:hypothetical protein [Microbulbifer sp. GX H0434]